MPAEEKNKVIYVSHPSGSTAEIALYGINILFERMSFVLGWFIHCFVIGATVTSWKTRGVERLFVR